MLKDIPPEQFGVAVRTVAAGGALLAPSVTRRLIGRSARVLVVFIDEDQSITPKDDCRLQDLRAIADRTGASYQELELTEQHRSGGSDAYEAWVDALLEGRPITWTDQWKTTGCSLLVAPSYFDLKKSEPDPL